MAKGLKIGDVVTVRKEQPVPKDEAAYQAGLTTVMPRQRGRIVKATDGRGFIVDFDSREVVLSAQALDILPEPPAKVVPVKGAKRGRKPATKVVPVAPPETISVAVSDSNSNVNVGVSTSNAEQDAVAEKPTPQTIHSIESLTIIDKVDKDESLLDYLNQENEGFIRLVANALLVAGNSPDVVLLSELRFMDLPERVQQRVQTLIRAKLALTLK
jgi:hypothetical protein